MMKDNSGQPNFGPPADGLDSPTEQYVPPADGLDSPTEQYIPPTEEIAFPQANYEGQASSDFQQYVPPQLNLSETMHPVRQETAQYSPVFPEKQIPLAYQQAPMPSHSSIPSVNPNYYQMPPEKHTGRNIIIALLILIILLLIGVAVGFFIIFKEDDDSDLSGSDTQSQTVESDVKDDDKSDKASKDSQSDSGESDSGGDGEKEDSSDSSKDENSSSDSGQNQTTTAPPQPAPQWPPVGSTGVCGGGVAVNDVTSCEFASNVASSYYSHGNGMLYGVYSPVTNLYYDMTCSSFNGVATCTGGNNARVFIRVY